MKVEDQALLASAVQDMAPEARASILTPLYSSESGRSSEERSSQEDLVKLLEDVNKKVNEYEKQTEKLVKLLGQIQNEIALLKQNEEMTLAKTLLIDNFIGSFAQNGPAPYQGPSQLPSQSRSQPISQQLVSPRISTPVPADENRFKYDPEVAQPITSVNTGTKKLASALPSVTTIISSESFSSETELSSLSTPKTSTSSKIQSTTTSTPTTTTRMRPVARMRQTTTRSTTTKAEKVIPRTIQTVNERKVRTKPPTQFTTSTTKTSTTTFSTTKTTTMKTTASTKMFTSTITTTTRSITTTSTTTTMVTPLPTESVSSIVPEKVPLTRSVDLVNKFLSAFEIAQNINDLNKKVEPIKNQPISPSPRPRQSTPVEVQTTLSFVSEDIVIPEVQTTIESVQGQESTTFSPRSKLVSDKNSRRRNKINQSMEFDLKLVSERNRRKRLRLKPVLIEIERNQQNMNDLNSEKIIENGPIDIPVPEETENLSVEETTFAIDVTTVTTTTSTVSPEGIDKTTVTPIAKSQPQNQVTMSPSEVNGNSSKSSNGLNSEKEFLIGQILGKNEEKSTTISPPLILPSSTSGISQTIPSTVSSTIQMSSMSSMPSTVIASQNINLVNGSSIQDPKGLIPSITSTDSLASSTTVEPTTMTTDIAGKCFILRSYSRMPAFHAKMKNGTLVKDKLWINPTGITSWEASDKIYWISIQSNEFS